MRLCGTLCISVISVLKNALDNNIHSLNKDKDDPIKRGRIMTVLGKSPSNCLSDDFMIFLFPRVHPENRQHRETCNLLNQALSYSDKESHNQHNTFANAW
ncbi:hypothetical protein BGS_0041 [Beggiatoa sp. SS]|nr:hypothetical protein BGS_0041 [Beggiatoa sp. SS]